jgi:DNA-binding MarR family transcriptional regulator
MAKRHAERETPNTDALLELDNQLCFALHAAARQVIKSYRPVLAELELTHPQYLVLLVLWAWARDREPRPTVKALGARLALDSGTLTPLLKRLESRGLVSRTRSTSDERELFVHVTPAGMALKRRAAQVPVTLLRRSPLCIDDVIQLRDQLKRIRVALTEASAAP